MVPPSPISTTARLNPLARPCSEAETLPEDLDYPDLEGEDRPPVHPAPVERPLSDPHRDLEFFGLIRLERSHG
jgi:hypothetical protein